MNGGRHLPIDRPGLVADELATLREQGYEVDADTATMPKAHLDRIGWATERSPAWKYEEPDGLAEIEETW